MIRQLFTDIAAIYDRMNHLFSFGRDLQWRREAVRRIPELGAAPRILDLACGTGDFTLALAKRFTKASITGADFTPTMLEIAQRKNTFPNISFCVADALNLTEFAAGTFDICTCAFGFRNFPDHARALQEVSRVIKPTGECVVLEFFRPQNRLLGFLTNLWLILMTFLFVRGRSLAYKHLRSSMQKMCSVTEFKKLAAQCNLVLCDYAFFFPCCTLMRFKKESAASASKENPMQGEK